MTLRRVQISVPTGGSGGGGGATSLDITDRLGTATAIVAEAVAGMLDATAVRFMSPETIAALVDAISLRYASLDQIAAQAETHQITARLAEALGAQTDAYLPILLTAEGLASQAETLALKAALLDALAAQAETHRLTASAQETNAALAESQLLSTNVGTTESNAAQGEAVKATLGLADANAAQVDEGTGAATWAAFSGMTWQQVADQNQNWGAAAGAQQVPKFTAITTDAMSFAEASMLTSTLSETNAAPTEAHKLTTGLVDSNAVPTEAKTVTTNTYATSNTVAGTAPVNPTNAQGANNGTTATVKAGGVANGTSTLTLTIPRTDIPNGGALKLRAWYSTAPGTGDTFTITYTDTGGNPATATLPSGNFLTTPYELALTAIHATNNPTVAFKHDATAPATGGQINVDAVSIQTVGAF